MEVDALQKLGVYVGLEVVGCFVSDGLVEIEDSMFLGVAAVWLQLWLVVPLMDGPHRIVDVLGHEIYLDRASATLCSWGFGR